MLDFQTFDHWDAQIWEQAGSIYHHAFDSKGGKPEKVLRNMFSKGIGYFHIVLNNRNIIAVAIVGKLKGKNTVIIDYLAVAPEEQHKEIGRQLTNYIKNWWKAAGMERIILEVEAEKSPENMGRIDFWRKCGFTLTDYIHKYIWVPESYQAMYLNLQPDTVIPKNGKNLFSYISKIHQQSFRGV